MAEDVEKIFGKRPWLSRSQEIMEDEQPKIDDKLKELPEVQAAIKAHEQAQQEDSSSENTENNDADVHNDENSQETNNK